MKRSNKKLVNVLWHTTPDGRSIALCRVPFDDQGEHRQALEAAMRHFSSESGHPTVVHEVELTDHPTYVSAQSSLPWWSQVAQHTTPEQP